MSKILLIASHYPPSNLTAVHRVRLFAKHLSKNGWDPIILTVNENFYEEELDYELQSLIPENQQIEKVSSFPLTKPRFIGDIGLRAFFQLIRRASVIIRREKIDFIYIFIPSFYLALLGKILFRRFGIRYGVDYIDPWVHYFPGSEKKFSRHWFSTIFAKILEPMAISDVSLITGVSEGYYTPVLTRNPYLVSSVKTLAIPYGWDTGESEVLKRLNKKPYLFHDKNKIKLVYAGAFLPKSGLFLEILFQTIINHSELFSDVEFHFIGTGKLNVPRDESVIKSLAQQYGIYGKVIFEHPLRVPYFDVLVHIQESSGVFILGSTESHYTPSKLFNAFMLKLPVFAVLHHQCSINEIIHSADWGIVVQYDEQKQLNEFRQKVADGFTLWKEQTIQQKWKFLQEKIDAFAVKDLIQPLVKVLNSFN